METVTLTVEQLAGVIAEGTKSILDQQIKKQLDAAVAERRERNELRRTQARRLSMAAAAILKADQAQGIVEAVANTTGVTDYQGDTIMPGAYAHVIAAGQRPAIVFMHDQTRLLGRVMTMRELPPGDPMVPYNQTRSMTDPLAGGLWMRAQFAMATQPGREAFELVAGDYVDEWSVAFLPDPASTKSDPKSGGFIISKVADLLEISPVIRGASLQTGTLSAKNYFPTLARWTEEQSQPAHRQLSAEPVIWPETPNFRHPEGFSGGFAAPFSPMERAMARLVARR